MYDGTTKGEYRIMLQGVGNKVFRYGSASEESIQAFADERLYLSAPFYAVMNSDNAFQGA